MTLNYDKIIQAISFKILELGSGDPAVANEYELAEVKIVAQAALEALQGELPEEDVLSFQSQGHTVTYLNTSNARELYNELKNLKEEE